MKMMEVVCGILEKDGRYLIARRGKGVHENIWEFPGGKIEEGECAGQAVVREIQEELELNVRVIEPICDIIDERQDCTIHVEAYLCEICSGNLVLHVHHEARFVKASELFDYAFEDADHKILELLNK